MTLLDLDGKERGFQSNRSLEEFRRSMGILMRAARMRMLPPGESFSGLGSSICSIDDNGLPMLTKISEWRSPRTFKFTESPFEPCPSIKTYVLHVNELCQMQWDYILDWPDGEQAKLWIYAYRCFQRNDHSEDFKEADNIPFDVPIWENLLVGISQHAANLLYASARVVGPLVPVANNYLPGADEAAKKRYDMRKYREMSQAGRKSE